MVKENRFDQKIMEVNYDH